MLHNFPIQCGKTISDSFLSRGIKDFSSAMIYIQDLPFKRNSNKNNPLIVLEEQTGTCGTKHAILKLLAEENEKPEIKLIMGIYKMNAQNTKQVKNVLEEYQLEYIPEAHNYLRMGNKIIDVTKRSFANTLFANDLLEEEEIAPGQIGDYKVGRHRAFLEQWLDVNKQIPYHLEKLWQIREECIEAISNK